MLSNGGLAIYSSIVEYFEIPGMPGIFFGDWEGEGWEGVDSERRFWLGERGQLGDGFNAEAFQFFNYFINLFEKINSFPILDVRLIEWV
jgi:hypothetical protein